MDDADAQAPPATGIAGKAGAVLVALLAVGLLFIAVDILTNGKLTSRDGGDRDDDTGT
jgi:hypothetical protein